MTRPTGTAWRNWKKARARQRLAAGLTRNPDSWDAEWNENGGRVAPPVLPSPNLDAEEIIAHQMKRFERKAEYEAARKLIRVDIPVSGPYGIVHFGDPHVDDDGCDWGQLKRDIQLVQETEGLYAVNVGDTRNNWVGRLARLFGEQGTSAVEALILAEYFIAQLAGRWLYIIGGNHDAWSGSDDPMTWISSQAHALYEPSEARLALTSPGGEVITVNARHDFAGGSMWNPVHAVSKAAQLGVRDDILICGHKHASGYGVVKSPDDGRVCHAIQVASYKVFDRYAREKGFRDQHISPCAVTIIDPDDHGPNRVTVFWDSVRAAEYLTFLRNRRKAA